MAYGRQSIGIRSIRHNSAKKPKELRKKNGALNKREAPILV
jgi:hypothetical protein